MKVLIVGMYTKTYMPYIEKYEQELKKNNVAYDIACFDREETKPLTKNDNIYCFHHKLGTDKKKKLLPYVCYFQFVSRLIKREQYDKLIILTTLPGVFLYQTLKKYKNNYIFDYRDISFEKWSWFKKIVNNIIKNSYASFLSSAGFEKVLQSKSNKVYITHNIASHYKEQKATELSEKYPLTIGFVGYVRYFEVNKALINAFANNERYQLSYIGVPYDDCDLIGYCSKNKIKNVSFKAEFNNSEKDELYKDIDFINSLYDINSKEVIPAIPNRLYDAAIYRKPILVATGTFLSEVVKKYSLGCTIDTSHMETLEECVRNYQKEYDVNEFELNCKRFLDSVSKDEIVFFNIVNEFIKG